MLQSLCFVLKAVIYFLASTRKRLVPGAVPSLNLPVTGAVPSLNLPVKTTTTSATTTQRELVRHQLDKPVVYHNLESFKKRILGLKMVDG